MPRGRPSKYASPEEAEEARRERDRIKRANRTPEEVEREKKRQQELWKKYKASQRKAAEGPQPLTQEEKKSEARVKIALYLAQWYEDHKEQIQKRNSDWYYAHREEVAERRRNSYGEANREYRRQYEAERRARIEKYGKTDADIERDRKHMEANKRWRDNNPEKVKGYAHKYYAADPEKYKQRYKAWVESLTEEQKELRRQKQKAWRDAHREELREKERKRREERKKEAESGTVLPGAQGGDNPQEPGADAQVQG